MKLLFAIVLSAIQIMSYNIRVSTASDGENDWEIRKPASVQMILDCKPDIVGLQEAMENQVLYLQENCTGYEVIGVNREDGLPVKGEHMTMLYRSSTMKCWEWGTFWLSDTPDIPSMGWDGAYQRSATWALMQDRRDGRIFFMVNTHLDHVGTLARSKGLALIQERISQINPNNYPVVLTGDFNCTLDFPALEGIRNTMDNAREKAVATDNTDSYNAWGGKGGGKIDFIWYKGFSKCKWFRTITKSYGVPFISDHYPISALLK